MATQEALDKLAGVLKGANVSGATPTQAKETYNTLGTIAGMLRYPSGPADPMAVASPTAPVRIQTPADPNAGSEKGGWTTDANGRRVYIGDYSLNGYNPDGSLKDTSGGAGGSSAYDTELRRYLDESSPEAIAKREAAIRDQAAARRQAQIDAINGVYNARSARESAAGDVRLAQTRSVNLRAGLGGSDFGAANKDETRTNTRKNLDAIDAERGLEITRAIGEIDALTEERIKNQNEATYKNTEQRMNAIKALGDRATDKLKSLGSAGVTLEKIKSDSKLYADLKGLTGMSDLEINAMLTASKPKSEQAKWTYTTRKDGTIIGHSDLGEVKTFGDVKVPPEVDPEIKQFEDGTVVYFDKNNPTDANGNVAWQKLGNFINKTDEAYKKSQIAKNYSDINNAGDKNEFYKPTEEEKSAMARYVSTSPTITGPDGAKYQVSPADLAKAQADPGYFHYLLQQSYSDPKFKEYLTPLKGATNYFSIPAAPVSK